MTIVVLKIIPLCITSLILILFIKNTSSQFSVFLSVIAGVMIIICLTPYINSLITTTKEKGEEFKANQTIRVLDQIATDVSSVFNSKYLGKIANNEAGRTSLWNDVATLFKEYQQIQAIENFEDTDITVAIGNDKKSVTINSAVQVINAMEKLYMTVVVE